MIAPIYLEVPVMLYLGLFEGPVLCQNLSYLFPAFPSPNSAAFSIKKKVKKREVLVLNHLDNKLIRIS
jgi:hypothetical protein